MEKSIRIPNFLLKGKELALVRAPVGALKLQYYGEYQASIGL